MSHLCCGSNKFWLQTSCFIGLIYVPVASFPMYVLIHVSLFCSAEEVVGSRANAAEEVDVAGGWLRHPFFARTKGRLLVNTTCCIHVILLHPQFVYIL